MDEAFEIIKTGIEFFGSHLVFFNLLFAIDEYRYETMIFEDNGRYNDLYCDRYTTKREAIDCHVEIVDKMKKGIKVWDGWNY